MVDADVTELIVHRQNVTAPLPRRYNHYRLERDFLRLFTRPSAARSCDTRTAGNAPLLTKITFSATYFRHLRLHLRPTTSGADRIASLTVSSTQTSLLACCTNTFYWWQKQFTICISISIKLRDWLRDLILHRVSEKFPPLSLCNFVKS